VSKLSDEFSVNLRLDQASSACREAIESIGWKIESAEPTRIVTKVGFGLTRNPSKIEVLVNDLGPAEASVRLNGKIFGMGPVQKSHLTKEMERLRNAIESSARQAEQ